MKYSQRIFKSVLFSLFVLTLGAQKPNRSPEGEAPARPVSSEPKSVSAPNPAAASSLAVGNHGLTELARRRGWRRMDDTRRGKTFLSERTIFRDTQTGCLVWRMTCDPAVDVNDYYDIPSWNANGSIMGFLSRRTGNKIRWLMDANGANLRPMPTADGKSIGSGYWSVVYPDRFYHAIREGQETRVVATHPLTGAQQTIVSVRKDMGAMMPPHPSEKWFLFGRQSSSNEDFSAPSSAFVVGLDGSVREIKFERRWHRLRFTRSPDCRIFFNFDDPRTQWTILPDGSDRTSIPDPGSHPDWLAGGAELTYYSIGSIWAVRYDGTGKRLVLHLGSGGHGGPTLDGDWFVSDTPRTGNYPNSILYLRTDGSETCHTICKHGSSYYGHTALWHPDHHSSHPHPISSPDGTKTLFNSDFLTEFTDIYVAVNRLPDPPQNVSVRVEGTKVVVSWERPRRGREICGYNIYKTSTSGINYRRLNPTLIPATETTDFLDTAPAYYVVTAVEYSGLESRPSEEVSQRGNAAWEGPARIALEAETGTIVLPMEERVGQPDASNLYCVASRAEKAGGHVVLNVVVPKTATYVLWARVKGDGALAATCNGTPSGSLPCVGSKWSWQKSQMPLSLSAGSHELKLQAEKGTESVDKILLTDDRGFVPNGLLAVDETPPAAPVHVAAKPCGPNSIAVSWVTKDSSDIDHYNVYAAPRADFACTQATLVGSPSEREWVDWGLPVNSTYFYRVTAVDRAGNESAPSPAVQAGLPRLQVVRVELKPASAIVENMAVKEIAAAGGPVLLPTQPRNAAAEWEFDIPSTGDYAIWGRSMHDAKQRVVFDLVLDGKPIGNWQVRGLWQEWVWSAAGNRTAGSPQVFALQAGKHTLRLQPRTANAPIADIAITNDPTWWPAKFAAWSLKKR